MFLTFIKKYYLIITIIVIGAILRLVGIFYGYPLSLVYDETPGLAATLKMIGTYSLRANAFQYYYPAGLSYIYLPFAVLYFGFTWLMGFWHTIADLKQEVLLNLGAFIPIVRVVSVLLGGATVALVYLISQKLFTNRRISLLSAWLSAISFSMVANSHYGQTWTAQTFFILLVLLWSLNFYFKPTNSWRDYLAAGLLVGLAFSINFVGILSYFWFLLAHFLKNKSQKFIGLFITHKKFWFANITLILIIGLVYYLNPFGLNNYFGRIFSSSPTVNSYSFLSLNSLRMLLAYIKNGLLVEPIFFILALPAIFILWRQNKLAFWFLTPWLFIYLFFLIPLTNPMTRYLLPTIPVLIILTAYLVHYCAQKFNHSSRTLLALVIVISLPNLAFSLLFDYRLLQPDTRVLSYHWLEKNITAGSSILNLDLGVELPLVENQAIIRLIQEKMPALYSSQRQYLLSLTDHNYPYPHYFIVNYKNLVPSNYIPDYFVISAFDKNQLILKSSSLPHNKQLIKTFYPLNQPPLKQNSWPTQVELQIPFNNFSFNPLSLFKLYPAYGPYIEIYQITDKSTEQ